MREMRGKIGSDEHSFAWPQVMARHASDGMKGNGVRWIRDEKVNSKIHK
jgi:hypothetical protein